MSFQIPTGDDLVDFLKDFTGSSNDAEIKKAIYMAELSMRNIELPALRSNPYAAENIGIADSQGRIPIPADMNKPILFFKQGQPGGAESSPTGPWIVYDRIGDRDIITQGMIAQLYLSPVNVPAVIRGKFSEVYNEYQFLPWIGEGAEINLYYYKAWPLLFSPVTGGDPGETVQTNAVLQTWAEGYVYASLREYYIKRHNSEDAAVYETKYNQAYAIVEDQNNLGKWSGGHTRLTSVWQPRQYRQYNIK
jgi:hypothetical protein